MDGWNFIFSRSVRSSNLAGPDIFVCIEVYTRHEKTRKKPLVRRPVRLRYSSVPYLYTSTYTTSPLGCFNFCDKE